MSCNGVVNKNIHRGIQKKRSKEPEGKRETVRYSHQRYPIGTGLFQVARITGGVRCPV